MNVGGKRSRESDDYNDIEEIYEEDVTSGSEYSPDDTLSDDETVTRQNRRRRAAKIAKTNSRSVCSYKENCYRKNIGHFRQLSHPHLEKILAEYSGSGPFVIPSEYKFISRTIEDQLGILRDSQIYSTLTTVVQNSNPPKKETPRAVEPKTSLPPSAVDKATMNAPSASTSNRNVSTSNNAKQTHTKNERPKRKIEDFFNVVAPRGLMAEKHAKSAPYHIFYTTITSAPDTHKQPLSITFQELLDPSLGDLEMSLQINFMVDVGWLLAQYYFAGYCNIPLTILYGDDSDDLKSVNKKKPNVETYQVQMRQAFGTHHTKMSILCYEDGSLRVVISTANLYIDDWENRTQGLWLSPKCPKLSDPIDIIAGESPTGFKSSLLNYLNTYNMPCLMKFIEKVKQADFSAINVFFIGSVPGSHFNNQWALTRLGNLLSKHCIIPESENQKWDLIIQASSIGSFGANPLQWLCGDFKSNLCKLVKGKEPLSRNAELRFIYPSLANVRQSHDNLIGGGCLPYSKSINDKQPWLKSFLYQWSAVNSGRNMAMPHIKSYLRISQDASKAAYFVLTSANVSKSAWGSINKGNGALRVNSYEAGVLFIPKFVVSKDFFSIDILDKDRLPLPYDLPPIPYSSNDVPWVMDYLR